MTHHNHVTAEKAVAVRLNANHDTLAILLERRILSFELLEFYFDIASCFRANWIRSVWIDV